MNHTDNRTAALKAAADAKRAEQVLRDALTASALPVHQQVALWCAADSWRRACVRAERERHAVSPEEVV